PFVSRLDVLPLTSPDATQTVATRPPRTALSIRFAAARRPTPTGARSCIARVYRVAVGVGFRHDRGGCRRFGAQPVPAGVREARGRAGGDLARRLGRRPPGLARRRRDNPRPSCRRRDAGGPVRRTGGVGGRPGRGGRAGAGRAATTRTHL